MAQDRSTADAILTEHFRYTPLSVIDDTINSVNTIIYKALTALEAGLLSQPPKALGFSEPKSSKSKTANADKPASTLPAAEQQRAEIENGTHALETLLEAAVDKNFDIFELFALQNIFNIKPDLQANVRLRHYDALVWPVPADSKDDKTQGTEAVTPEQIKTLRNTLRAERELGLALSQENAAVTNVLSQLKALVAPEGSLGFLFPRTQQSDIARSNTNAGVTLTPTAQFTTSQLPSLKTLVLELKSKMATLPSSAEQLRSKDVPGSTSDEERRRYVETVAKRAVREKLGAGRASGENALGAARGAEEVGSLEGLLSRRRDDEDEGID